MNSVILIGRLTADPDIKYISSSQTAVANFSVAVDRQFTKDKEKVADFFKVIVFGKSAENCEKYLVKGRLVGVQGRLQNNNYTTQSGEKRYTIEVIADRVEFLEWGEKKKDKSDLPEGFSEMQDGEDIPF